MPMAEARTAPGSGDERCGHACAGSRSASLQCSTIVEFNDQVAAQVDWPLFVFFPLVSWPSASYVRGLSFISLADAGALSQVV